MLTVTCFCCNFGKMYIDIDSHTCKPTQSSATCRSWTGQHRATISCLASMCSPSGSLTVPTSECWPSRSCMQWARCLLHTCHPLSRMRRRVTCQTIYKPCSNYRQASPPHTMVCCSAFMQSLFSLPASCDSQSCKRSLCLAWHFQFKTPQLVNQS